MCNLSGYKALLRLLRPNQTKAIRLSPYLDGIVISLKITQLPNDIFKFIELH